MDTGITEFNPYSSDAELCEKAVAAIYHNVFVLLDRDRSNYADEADVVAALECWYGVHEKASRALARVSADGHVDGPKFRTLIESTLSSAAPADEIGRHTQTVQLLLAIVKDFEKRSNARGEYQLASSAREVYAEIQRAETQRSLFVLQRRQQVEREKLTKQQSVEANDFNSAWKKRMAEFGKLSSRAIEEMRAKHENAVEEFLATHRPALVEHCERHCKDRDTLDSMKVLRQLAAAREFAVADKYLKYVDSVADKNHANALAKAEVRAARAHACTVD